MFLTYLKEDFFVYLKVLLSNKSLNKFLEQAKLLEKPN